jgi:23S rRNA (pseudouridine1915-N3)-methyltransferase
MNITILCVGHLKENYWKEAEAEYLKRLQAYARVSVVELDDLPTKEKNSPKEEAQVKEKEGERILSRLKPSDFVCLLDLGKAEPTSPEFALEMKKMLERGGANLTFVIGGSLGLGDNIKKRGNASVTLSKLTFPHQLARIVLLEQIYRNFKILSGEPYHK